MSNISDIVFNQIMDIRNSGEVNMLDVKAVFEIAVRKGYDELADFIFTDTAGYSTFIISGQR